MSQERRTVVVTELAFLTARTLAKARQAAASLPDASQVVPVGLDVTSEHDASSLERAVREHADRVDVPVNNAAIHYDTDQVAIDADLRVVSEALETNVIGAWRTTLALLPVIRASTRGRIVNVSSGAGSLQDMGSGTPAYRVSKAAAERPYPHPRRRPAGRERARQRRLPGPGANRHGRLRRAAGGRRSGLRTLGGGPTRRRPYGRLLPRRPPHRLLTLGRTRHAWRPSDRSDPPGYRPAGVEGLLCAKLGLELVSENDDAVTFRCGGETRLTVSASTTGPPTSRRRRVAGRGSAL